ncbi:hypothetical protein ACFX16_038395 [Malus domestica]
MIANLKVMNNIAPYNGDAKITVGSGESLPVSSIGSSIIRTPNHALILHNVLHVPRITMNLLSVKKLCRDNGCWFICDDLVFFIQDKATRVMLYQGKSDDGELFKILVTVFSKSSIVELEICDALVGKKVKSSIWHKRLGHPSEEIINKMLTNAQLQISIDTCPSLCPACIHGKTSRLPFHVKQERSKVLFEKIHLDVWGPSPQKSIEGFRYYISFIDDCSRFVWIYPMINKSDAFSIFCKFYAFVVTQFNGSIKYLQSDGGGEYMSKKFKQFLDSKWMIHHISCPHTPQQNGLAERKHRHVVETTISLLSDAQWSSLFWYHACSHAAFLINRMPCKGLGMKSPYQVLFGQNPDIHSLKVFGTVVYPLLRPFNNNKLQPRSIQCVCLGFALGYK